MSNDNTKKVKVQLRDKIKIHSKQKVKCIVQGERYLDTMYAKKKPVQGAVKLSKDEYIVLSTGEIKQYNYGTEKSQRSLHKTFNELRRIIRANFTEGTTHQLFVTLDYLENMKDPKRLMDEYEKFWKRLTYRMKGHKLDYVAVAEPQGRGAWHMHVMMKSDKPVLIIDKKEISMIWGDENIVRQLVKKKLEMSKEEIYKMSLEEVMNLAKVHEVDLPKGYRPVKGHGWATTERLKSDDVGSYYVSYFTDTLGSSGNRKKGERLHMYPKGFKFFRCSRGIKRPEVKEALYGEVVKEFGKPQYVSTYALVKEGDGNEEILNVIQKETFKKRAKREI